MIEITRKEMLMSAPTSISCLDHCGMKPMFRADGDFVDYVFVGMVFSTYGYDIMFNPATDTTVAVWDLGQEGRPYDPDRKDKAPDSVFDLGDELVTRWIEYRTGVELSRSEPHVTF